MESSSIKVVPWLVFNVRGWMCRNSFLVVDSWRGVAEEAYSQYASWSDLASKLYHREHHEVLSAAKKFIKKTFGKCMCVYSNT